ncbi:MAG TPA: tyrosine-type recombinase/integrase [Candidatus Acidoferrum sp.]
MAKRRFQQGLLKKENGHFYSFFYRDQTKPDGTSKSVFTRIELGKVGKISDLSAQREHDRLRQQINRERGSVPTAPKGETFAEVAKTYMTDIGPQLSISTVRQRSSHLNAHLAPRFGSIALMAIDVPTLQRFVTDLSTTLSRKSILNVLGTLNAVLSYAKKCGIRVPEIPERSLVIAGDRDGTEAVYFKTADVQRIIVEAREPYRTIFVLAAVTGLRAGELLGLTVGDIDFDRLMICPRRQADDRTRILRELKTKKSRTAVPITKETATLLRSYLKLHWRSNPRGLLFPNRTGRPCKRANVVTFGLHPILKKLGLPKHRAGLHAFRHGLGTALADSGASPAIVQRTLRHSDIKTTLRFYVHADADSQRTALANIQSLQFGDNYK